MTQTLPLIALAPLVVLWFGFGILPKILLVAFVTYFPMVVGCLRGFDSAEPEAERLLRSMGAGRWMVFRMVGFPPLFHPSSPLRISVPTRWWVPSLPSTPGPRVDLVCICKRLQNVFRTDLVLAAVVVSTVLTLALYAGVTH